MDPIVERFYRAKVRVHFLGTTRYEILVPLPVRSCDSSSWTQAGARGHILYWNPEKPGMDKTDKIYLEGTFPFDEKRTYFIQYRHRRELEIYLQDELGLTYMDIMGPQWAINRALVNVHYFVRLEKRIMARHRELGFSF